MAALKVQIDRAAFFYLVSQAYSLIEKRSVMPILSKVLIYTKQNNLHIQATDQDNSLQSHIPAQVEKEGQIVVDAQNLFDILRELDDKEILLAKEEHSNKIQLKQETSVFFLKGQDVKDFPSFPPFKMKKNFFIKAADLKFLIDKTVYCTSLDETRYHLTGVFFESMRTKTNQQRLRFVATDGHRLAVSECSCEQEVFKNGEGVIIPKKGIMEIKKLISQPSDDPVEVSIEKPRILFRQKDTILSIKLVEGSYPNYQQLIPKDKQAEVFFKVKADVFHQALRRVSLLSNNRFKGVTFQIKGKKIQMEAEHPELGSAQNEIESVRKTGSDLKIRFNARYILEAINSLNCEEVEIELKNKTFPCLIRPSEENKEKKNQETLCVIMPMQI